MLKVEYHQQDQQELKVLQVDKGILEHKVQQVLVVQEVRQELKVLKVEYRQQDQQEPKAPQVDKDILEHKVQQE